jgi:hypothetical protein
MYKEKEKKIKLNPPEMDLNYLDINDIINIDKYRYPYENDSIFTIYENLIYFLERFSSIIWKKYFDSYKDADMYCLYFRNDISLASDEFLSNIKDRIDKSYLLRSEGNRILGLIDNFLDDYNQNLVDTVHYIRRDDLNFLAQFLLRLADRLENLKEIKAHKKPKN